MASLARTSGVTFTAAATPEEFIGKDIKFFAVVVKNGSGTAADISAENAAEEAVDLINQAVTSVGATILIIQYNATGQLSYALEGATDNWTAATLQTAIRALGTANSIDVSGTTVTDVGFKLALS